MEPISLTAGAIATLAFTKVFETSVEKFTEAAIAKMDILRKKIWDKLRGNIKAETASGWFGIAKSGRVLLAKLVAGRCSGSTG